MKDLAKVVQSKDVQLRAIEDGKSRVILYMGVVGARANRTFSLEAKGP